MDIVGRLEDVKPNQEPTMSTVSIRITTETRKELEQTLSRAFKAGDVGVIKRVTALLGIARDEPVTVIAEGVGVSPSTVYGWLRAFLLEGVAGLRVQWRGGRPRKLTKTQRGQIRQAVGPQEDGHEHHDGQGEQLAAGAPERRQRNQDLRAQVPSRGAPSRGRRTGRDAGGRDRPCTLHAELGPRRVLGAAGHAPPSHRRPALHAELGLRRVLHAAGQAPYDSPSPFAPGPWHRPSIRSSWPRRAGGPPRTGLRLGTRLAINASRAGMADR